MDGTQENAATARLGAAIWFCVALFAAMGAALVWMTATQAMDAATRIGSGAYAVVALGVGGGMAALAVERIDADESGIRWRTWRGVKRIDWSEVSDYYLLPPRQQGERLAVVTRQGTIHASTATMGGGAFRDVVKTFATEASDDDWAMRGCREREPEPVVFRYDTRWSFAPVLVFGAFALLAGIGLHPHGRVDIDLIARYVGPGWAFAFAALGWILPTCVLAFLAIAFARIAQDVRRRRRDTVTITPGGISFANARRRVEARWDEVVGWELSRSREARLEVRLRIETTHGNFDATPRMRDFWLLTAILRCRCGGTRTVREIDVLPVDTAPWVGASAKPNTTVYHYRTRSNRMIMLAPWILLVCIGGVSLAVRHLDLPDSHTNNLNPAAPAVMLGAVVAAGAWMALHYLRDVIVVDDEAITQISFLGSRRLLWSEVESYRYDGSRAVLRGGKTVIVFSGMVARFADLFREIQKRAVNSGNKSWNTVPKGYGLDDLAAANRSENRSSGV